MLVRCGNGQLPAEHQRYSLLKRTGGMLVSLGAKEGR